VASEKKVKDVRERMPELIHRQSQRRYQNMTNEEYIKLLESYVEDGKATTTPELEMWRGNDPERKISDILLKQHFEWQAISRCCDCGMVLEPPRKQCDECFELNWLWFLKRAGQIQKRASLLLCMAVYLGIHR
jgi:hypothetical protein